MRAFVLKLQLTLCMNKGVKPIKMQNQSDSPLQKRQKLALRRFELMKNTFKIPEAQGSISCHISKVKNNYISEKSPKAAECAHCLRMNYEQMSHQQTKHMQS